MPSPFPGMDPYLEAHWRDVHSRLIIYASDQLRGELPNDLRARVEKREFVETEGLYKRSVYPDVRIIERPIANGGPGVSTRGGAVAVAEPILIDWSEEPVTETYVEIREFGSGGKIVTVIEFVSLADKQPGEGRRHRLQPRPGATAGAQ